MNFNTLYSKEEAERFFNIVKGKQIVLLTNGKPWATGMYFIPKELKDPFYSDHHMIHGSWVSQQNEECAYDTAFMVFRGFEEYNEMDLLGYNWVFREQAYSAPKCECGADKCNLPTHSSWCPKCKE